MALRFISKTIPKKTTLMLFALLVVVLTATSTQAGFQWVPAQDETMPPMMDDEPSSPSSSSSIEVLPAAPMPVDEESAAPEEPPMLPPIKMKKMAEPKFAEPINTQPEPVMQIKRVSKTPEPVSPRYASPPTALETPAPMAEKVMAEPMMETPETLKMPPRMPTDTKVIMPDDAPSSALTISSFPEQQDLAVTKDEPLFATRPQASQGQRPWSVPPSEAPGTYEIVQGFGSDVPLALALRQIVPANFAFSFGENVNPGYRVSWTGGKPWNEVVQGMIQEFNYALRVRGKMVLIYVPDTASAEPSFFQEPMSDGTLASTNTDSYFRMQDIKPAAGTAEEETIEWSTTPVSRERDVRRINVVDPGAEQQNTQPDGVLQKLASAANDATQILGLSGSSQQPQSTAKWSAHENTSLKETLDQWSQQAGVTLVWDVTYDYTITSRVDSNASFEEAIQTLINTLPDGREALNVKFLGDGPQQLLVQEKA